MAKKFYTLDQIMNMSQRDLLKLSEAELRKVVSSERSISRKRMERLESREEYTPAYSELLRSGGVPTVKGMDKLALINEHKKYKKFNSAVTSTITGAKRVKKQAIENLKSGINEKYKLPENFPDVAQDQYFNELADFIEQHPKEIWSIVDDFRDNPKYNFNYNDVKAIATQKLYNNVGRGNKGSLYAAILRDLQAGYTEMRADAARDTGFLASDSVETTSGFDWIKDSFK